MNKIGIYTFWNVPNYGTFMQAYALQNVIDRLCSNACVQQINYLDSVHYSKYYNIVPKGFVNPWINIGFYKTVCKNVLSFKQIKRRKKFLKYYEAISQTERLSVEELESLRFDCVVLGSDIVWDWSIESFNHDPHLFGNGFNCSKVISYACSFGTVKQDMRAPEYVKTGLDLQRAISVRDQNSVNLVKQISGRAAEIVADPTFLWDMESDKNIPGRKIKYKYIIVYGPEFEIELINGAKKYAKEHDLRLVCLDSMDDSFDWCDISVSQDDMTPFDWCSYFKYAEIIFTCTYHGLMFGLIFNKPIVFSPRRFILDKVSSLMEYVGIRQPFIELQEFQEKADWNWQSNYKNVINPRINALKKRSIQYLEKSLVELK